MLYLRLNYFNSDLTSLDTSVETFWCSSLHREQKWSIFHSLSLFSQVFFLILPSKPVWVTKFSVFIKFHITVPLSRCPMCSVLFLQSISEQIPLQTPDIKFGVIIIVALLFAGRTSLRTHILWSINIKLYINLRKNPGSNTVYSTNSRWCEHSIKGF